MNRFPVSSTNLASIGYEEFSQTLEVEFNNGSLYQYFDVPDSVFEELKTATSHGSYFNQVIRNNYRYSKL